MLKDEYKRASVATTLIEIVNFSIGVVLYNIYPTKYAERFISVSYIFIIWLHYTLDILFVKRSHTDDKIRYYLNSFVKFKFVKYLVVSIIYFISLETATKYVMKQMDHLDLKYKYRNVIIRTIINACIIALYIHYLKFKWAYVDNTDPVMNIIVMSWCSILIVLFMIFQHVNR